MQISPTPCHDPAPPASRRHWGVPRPPLQLRSAALIGRNKHAAEGENGGGRASWRRCHRGARQHGGGLQERRSTRKPSFYTTFRWAKRGAHRRMSPRQPPPLDPRPGKWPPGGSTWPTPEGGPAALLPRPGVQRCSRGLRAVPANPSRHGPRVHASAGRCQPQAARNPAPSQKPHRSSAVRSRTAASAEQRIKGRETCLGALCHFSRLAIVAGLLKPHRPDCPASSAAPATGRSGARLGACPGVPHRAVRHERARHGA